MQRAVEMLSERRSPTATIPHVPDEIRFIPDADAATGFGPGKRPRCWTRSPSTRATGGRWSTWGWPTSATTGSTSTSRPAAANWPGEAGHPAGPVGARLPDGAGRDPHARLPVARDAALPPGQRRLPRAHPAGRVGTPHEAAAGLPGDARRRAAWRSWRASEFPTASAATTPGASRSPVAGAQAWNGS